MIFQDPMTSLNPVLTISNRSGSCSNYTWVWTTRLHASAPSNCSNSWVYLPPSNAWIITPINSRAGMRSRAMIAMALSCNPNLLLVRRADHRPRCDHPGTNIGIAASPQRRVQDGDDFYYSRPGCSGGTVRPGNLLCDGGRIMEHATTLDLYTLICRHPYTLGLLNSVPRLDEERKERLVPIPGMPPDMINAPQGCPFYPRCTYREPRNREANAPSARCEAGP